MRIAFAVPTVCARRLRILPATAVRRKVRRRFPCWFPVPLLFLHCTAERCATNAAAWALSCETAATIYSPLPLLRVLHATEPERARTIFGRCHQQVLAVLVETVGAGEIPAASAGAIVAAAAQDGGARMLILVFIGPLPDVAREVHHAERAGAFRESIDIGGSAQLAAVLGRGHAGVAGGVAPRIHTVVGTLRGVLPFPFVRQALAGPTGVGARVFQRHPGHRLVAPSGGKVPVRPIAQEIMIVDGTIVGGGEECRELL